MRDFAARRVITTPYFRRSWPGYKTNLSPVFVEEFEELIGLDLSLESSDDTAN